MLGEQLFNHLSDAQDDATKNLFVVDTNLVTFPVGVPAVFNEGVCVETMDKTIKATPDKVVEADATLLQALKANPAWNGCMTKTDIDTEKVAQLCEEIGDQLDMPGYMYRARCGALRLGVAVSPPPGFQTLWMVPELVENCKAFVVSIPMAAVLDEGISLADVPTFFSNNSGDAWKPPLRIHIVIVCQSTASQPLLDLQSTAGRPPVNRWSTANQPLVDLQSTAGRPPVNRWSTASQPLVDLQSTAGRPPVNRWSSASQRSSTSSQPLLDLHTTAVRTPLLTASRILQYVGAADGFTFGRISSCIICASCCTFPLRVALISIDLRSVS